MIYANLLPRLTWVLLLPMAFAQTCPRGWQASPDGKVGVQAFQPKELAVGELLRVQFGKRQRLEGRPLEVWLGAELAALAPPAGQWQGQPKVEKGTANIATANRAYVAADGSRGFVLLTAVTMDGQLARHASVACSSEALFARHRAAATALVGELAPLERQAAVAEERGLKLEAAPPAVAGIRAGGPLRPGRYAGNLITTSDQSVLRALEVLVFANGEYEFLQGQSSRSPSGLATYSPGTGRLQLADPLWNSTYDPEEDFCIHGVEADGTVVIYAQEDRGTSVFKARLRLVGPVDRPPPTEVARLQAEAKAAAARYKWVTEPGRGIRDDELEVVLVGDDYTNDGLRSAVDSQTYVLMKDGRVRDGMPVPPNELDVALSRRREPDLWGTWRKQGDEYQFAWPVRPDEYAAPKGFVTIGKPFPKGTRLDGNFQSASSWGIAGGMGGANFWGVRFAPSGRFEKWRRGIAGSGAPSYPGQVSVGAAYDDHGAATSIAAENVGGGTVTRNDDVDRHRMGTYEFDGYTLVLTFDSGKVVRLPTHRSETGDSLWFEGASLNREKKSGK